MAWFCSGIHPHLTPNARPENYCDLPGTEESVKRVGNKLLFEDFKLAGKAQRTHSALMFAAREIDVNAAISSRTS